MRYLTKTHAFATLDAAKAHILTLERKEFKTSEANLIHVCFDPARRANIWALWDDNLVTTAEGIETVAIQRSPQKLTPDAERLMTKILECTEFHVDGGWLTMIDVKFASNPVVLAERSQGIGLLPESVTEMHVTTRSNESKFYYFYEWGAHHGSRNCFMFTSVESLERHLAAKNVLAWYKDETKNREVSRTPATK